MKQMLKIPWPLFIFNVFYKSDYWSSYLHYKPYLISITVILVSEIEVIIPDYFYPFFYLKY